MPLENTKNHKSWFKQGYKHGFMFAREEADYDELAAICRVGNIPKKWDIFRAEIIHKYLTDPGFDFKDYVAGFSLACRKFFEKI